MLTWGIVLCCHVACKDKAGIYPARFFLGAAEAGVFPGVILQMTYWYRPDEMSVRLLYFCKFFPGFGERLWLTEADILGNLSGVFGGLFAYGFDLASSSSGLSGWQLLFLFEGLFTIVVAVVISFCLPDCKSFSNLLALCVLTIPVPNTARWLSEKEKAFVQARLPPQPLFFLMASSNLLFWHFAFQEWSKSSIALALV